MECDKKMDGFLLGTQRAAEPPNRRVFESPSSRTAEVSSRHATEPPLSRLRAGESHSKPPEVGRAFPCVVDDIR